MSDLHPHTITEQDERDLLATAFEGGINYWAGKAEVISDPWPKGAEYASDVPSLGGRVELHYDDPHAGDDGDFTGRYVITDKQLRQGIRKAAAHRGLTARRFLDEADAESADIAIQFMIFGEVVYG